MSVHVIRDTKFAGVRALHKRLSSDNREVLVGVPQGKTEADGTPTAMIAAVHEFGLPSRGTPERSFLRAGILKNLAAITRLNEANIVKIARGGFTALAAMNQLGAFAAGQIQRFMVEGDFTPNAPRTIARKGSAKPLIDTGALRQAITWTVSSGGSSQTAGAGSSEGAA